MTWEDFLLASIILTKQWWVMVGNVVLVSNYVNIELCDSNDPITVYVTKII